MASSTYDVFLSFRGEDTRNNFTSHLHEAFCGKKIETFIDNELNRGDEISPSLLHAIEESKISIIVFSEGYASSRWCLEELVKILECKKEFGQIMIPIFYHIDPSDVRSQRRTFAVAFTKHEERFKERLEEVKSWRTALTEAANLSGYHVDGSMPESVIIKEIIKDVLRRLNHMSPTPSENNDLVGIERSIREVESLLSIGTKGVRYVGIWGMGGIGKTTLARTVCEKLSNHFETSHFLDVREISENHGINELKETLFSSILEDKCFNLKSTFIKSRLQRKKALIVIDDVTSLSQIENLTEGLESLGCGSRIIITTRNKELLENCRVGNASIYKVERLSDADSFQLLKRYAFERSVPTVDYEVLMEKIINYSQGLPLALKVCGSSLLLKKKEVWESAITKLEKEPPNDILKVLKLSYDVLDDNEKEIFLDIACFFRWKDRDLVTKILDACDLYTKCGLSTLTENCLITISNNMINMHDLLQSMGRQISQEQFRNNPGEFRRLWRCEDVYSALTKNMGIEAIRGIRMDFSNKRDIPLNPNSFSKMHNLRFLIVYHNKFHGFQGLESNFTELRHLYWQNYPWKLLPLKVNLENLVVLEMQASNLKELWISFQNLVNLKYMDLSYSKHLLKISDLSQAPNLESLILQGCTSLSEITPPSIQNLNKLVYLNFRNCKSLNSVPTGIESKSLREVILSGCSNLKTAPKISCNMERLYLDGTAIEELSFSIEYPSKLVDLNLQNCARLESLPKSICKLKSLLHLSLSGCFSLKKVPMLPCNIEKLYLDRTAIIELPSIGHLSNLVELNLQNCSTIESLPNSIRELASLKNVYLSGCFNLKIIPEMPCHIEELYLDGTAIRELSASSIEHLSNLVKLILCHCSRLESLPNSICKLTSLVFVNLSHCSNLKIIPEMPCQIKRLHLEGTAIKELSASSIKHLSNLVILGLDGCKSLESLPSSIEHLSKLQRLTLDGCKSLESLPSSIEHLSSLTLLNLRNCSRLQSLPNGICRLKSLRQLNLSCCSILDRLPDNLGDLKSLMVLDVVKTAIRELPSSIVGLRGLYKLQFRACKGLQLMRLLQTLSGSIFLGILDLSYCDLMELPNSLGQLSSICYLNLSGNSFESIPESIINLRHLQFLNISYCNRLQSLPKLSCDSLEKLAAEGCQSLQTLLCSPFLSTNGEERTAYYCQAVCFIECSKLNLDTLGNILKVALSNIQKNITLMMDTRQLDIEELKQNNLFSLDEGCICFPGNEIPECIDIQRCGSFIELPRGLLNHKFVGMALCTVLAFSDYDCDVKEDLWIHCELRVKCQDGHYKEVTTGCFNAWWGWEKPKYIQLDHVFLGFDSSMFIDKFHEISNNSEAILSFDVRNKSKHGIKFDVSNKKKNKVKFCEVKKCGVHLFYTDDVVEEGEELQSKRLEISRFFEAEFSKRPCEKEVEEFNPYTNQSSSVCHSDLNDEIESCDASATCDLNEFPQDVFGSMMNVTAINQSLADGKEEEPGGNSCCGCDDEPQPILCFCFMNILARKLKDFFKCEEPYMPTIHQLFMPHFLNNLQQHDVVRVLGVKSPNHQIPTSSSATQSSPR